MVIYMNFKTLIAAFGALAFVTPALSQTEAPATVAPAAVAASKNMLVYSGDGAKIAPINRVVQNKDGTTASVKLIYNDKMLTIPFATLSTFQDGVKTSLTKAELKRM